MKKFSFEQQNAQSVNQQIQQHQLQTQQQYPNVYNATFNQNNPQQLDQSANNFILPPPPEEVEIFILPPPPDMNLNIQPVHQMQTKKLAYKQSNIPTQLTRITEVEYQAPLGVFLSENNQKHQKYILFSTISLGYILNLISVQTPTIIKNYFQSLLKTFEENKTLIQDNFLNSKIGREVQSARNFKRLFVLLIRFSEKFKVPLDPIERRQYINRFFIEYTDEKVIKFKDYLEIIWRLFIYQIRVAIYKDSTANKLSTKQILAKFDNIPIMIEMLCKVFNFNLFITSENQLIAPKEISKLNQLVDVQLHFHTNQNVSFMISPIPQSSKTGIKYQNPKQEHIAESIKLDQSMQQSSILWFDPLQITDEELDEQFNSLLGYKTGNVSIAEYNEEQQKILQEFEGEEIVGEDDDYFDPQMELQNSEF